MAKKNRNALYEEFKNGDIPNQNDFADTIDSALNLLDDGLTSYKVETPDGIMKRFGIGDTAPTAPLGIKGEEGADDEMISFTSHDASQKWNINLNPTGEDVAGFSIDDATAGAGTSRLFIDQTTGNVGMGTVEPAQKLVVSGVNSGGNVSIMVQNQESGTSSGWMFSAVNDNVTTERGFSAAIHENTGLGLIERMTFLSMNSSMIGSVRNTGINEMLPMATLHVTRLASDASEPVALAENTGILCLGQIDNNNLAMDSKQIQARHGAYVGETTTLEFTPSELVLQPYGGTITINKSTGTPSNIIRIGTNGTIGVGKTATEKVEVNGAVVFGNTTTAVPPSGTVRWSTTANDLQVWKDASWKSLTTHTNTDDLWVDGGDGIIYFNPAGHRPKVGIGTETPHAMLHVKETNTEFLSNSGGMIVVNQAATTSSDSGLIRMGLGISCTGTWSPNPAALNVGLYISGVTGQTTSSSNVGALINGNTVIGDITGNSLVGTNGTNVLAIQNGVAPTSTPGITETTGIQVYSKEVTSSSGTPFSAFHVMTGDGVVIKLFRQPDMTEANVNTPNTGNEVTNVLIENMRDRINQLERMMKTMGLLHS